MKSESYWQVNAHSQVKSMRDDNPAVVEIGPSLFSRPKVYSCACVWCNVSVCSVNCWYRRLVSGPVKRQFMDGMYFLTDSMGATKVSCCQKILDSLLRHCLQVRFLSFAQPASYQSTAGDNTRYSSKLTNGVPNQPSLEDLELTSGDRARRGETGTPDQSAPMSQQIEAQQIPHELSATLEHIVGQLDIITQVQCCCPVCVTDVLSTCSCPHNRIILRQIFGQSINQSSV